MSGEVEKLKVIRKHCEEKGEDPMKVIRDRMNMNPNRNRIHEVVEDFYAEIVAKEEKE